MQLDIDLTDPKAARKALSKAIREKKKADEENAKSGERARNCAIIGAYELIRQAHQYKRLTFTKYTPDTSGFVALVAKPPEARENEYARYVEAPVGMVLFDFNGLEIKAVFCSPNGVKAVIVRDHNIGRDRLLAIGTDESVVGVAEVFSVSVDVSADKPEPSTPETK